MFETLINKTIALLTLQLLITWVGAQAVVTYFRLCYWAGADNVQAVEGESGSIDIFPSGAGAQTFFYGNFIANAVIGLVLIVFFRQSADVGIWLFCIWSLTFGFSFGFIFIFLNENVAEKALTLTASISLLCALVGLSVQTDLSFMQPWLLVGLVILLIVNIGRGVMGLPDEEKRIKAIGGSLLFALYLVADFNALAQAAAPEQNSWNIALEISIQLYLDVINLLLQILEALGQEEG
ncbi:Bax inhibitor-1 family protein [Simiduia sp. 21SJ11W-1]|uniref:Bax inhibitor-1 family protein n=1 Tax=Simiduia sp. 21SJ11W-1 TaxID=2909669 RepID=UPI0020A10CE4|nr:Bax inhibitor-1 family protein [Simiduia sp. 21SJ11W-1]UTA49236.1 Bax inhibitor-1 family protein [Simiduia sp. 21SJ11W-1]